MKHFRISNLIPTPIPPNQKIKRSPVLFYIVLIACGIASGFSFEDIAYNELSDVLGYSTSPLVYALIMAAIGLVGGATLAHYYEDRYTHAINAIPWLLLGIVSFLFPLVVCLGLGLAVGISIIILGGIIGIFMCLCGLSICCKCCV